MKDELQQYMITGSIEMTDEEWKKMDEESKKCHAEYMERLEEEQKKTITVHSFTVPSRYIDFAMSVLRQYDDIGYEITSRRWQRDFVLKGERQKIINIVEYIIGTIEKWMISTESYEKRDFA